MTSLEQKPPSFNFKQPRKQVKSACSNCRKSKTACSSSRPCTRCVSHGLSCQDLPRKQRERKKNDGKLNLFYELVLI